MHDPAELQKIIQAHNPWWDSGQPPREIKYPRRFFLPALVRLALNWRVQRSVILMGARRVGKTVMLRQLIAERLQDKSVAARSVSYIAMDEPRLTRVSLMDLVALLFAAHPQARERLFVFDEIQRCPNWPEQLKVLTDRYPECRFVASGSAAASLARSSAEAGAGRLTDFALPPLLFCEFAQLTSKWPDGLPRRAADLLAAAHKPASIKKLNGAFQEYLRYGGYPEPTFNKEIRSDPARHLVADVIDKILYREMPSVFGVRQPAHLYGLFRYLADKVGTEISLDRMSSFSGLTKQTVQRYFALLSEALLIRQVRRIDGDFRHMQRQRSFKAYTVNPSMPALLNGISEANMGRIVENAVFAQYPVADSSMEELAYARWKEGRSDLEVDLVRYRRPDRRISKMVEIKWSDQLAPHRGLIRLTERYRAADARQVLRLTCEKQALVPGNGAHVKYVPCAIFCLAAGLEQVASFRDQQQQALALFDS